MYIYCHYFSMEPTHGVWLTDCSIQTTSWGLRPVVPAIYPAHPIHDTCHQSGGPLQNRSTAGHFPCKVATAKAVWPYCRSRTGWRPCTRTASFHQSSPRGLAPPERSSSMSACGRSFCLAECRGQARHPMMMMMMMDTLSAYILHGLYAQTHAFNATIVVLLMVRKFNVMLPVWHNNSIVQTQSDIKTNIC